MVLMPALCVKHLDLKYFFTINAWSTVYACRLLLLLKFISPPPRKAFQLGPGVFISHSGQFKQGD
jgi:hypothetical protein